MDRNVDGILRNEDLPLGCWHNVFQLSDPLTVARAASVNRTCLTASRDARLWYRFFKEAWSPESCGLLEAKQDGKDFHSLCARWVTGRPAAVDLVPGVHGPRSWVTEIQLSQAGPVVAWSVGKDRELVGTDVTTCQVRKRFELRQERYGATHGLTVLDSIGMVCIGGQCISGWDPRMEGNGSFPTPAFSVNYSDATRGQGHFVWAMISAGSPDSDGPPQLLTGGGGVYLWDLRFIDGGPVRHYDTDGKCAMCLATQPRHGLLLAGGMGGVTCWDSESGARLPFLRTNAGGALTRLAAGRDRVLSSGNYGNVYEWAIPDREAAEEDSDPQRVLQLSHTNNRMMPRTMQGLGEGPDRVLAATESGSICTWGCGEDPQGLPTCWSLGNHACPGVEVTSLAAIDQVVVNGFANGTMRVMRVDNHFGPDGI